MSRPRRWDTGPELFRWHGPWPCLCWGLRPQWRNAMNHYRKAAVLAVRIIALYMVITAIGDFIGVGVTMMTFQGMTNSYPWVAVATPAVTKLLVGIVVFYL